MNTKKIFLKLLDFFGFFSLGIGFLILATLKEDEGIIFLGFVLVGIGLIDAMFKILRTLANSTITISKTITTKKRKR